VSAAQLEREREKKMAEGFDQKRPPSPPFSLGAVGMLRSLSARERSWFALEFLGGLVGWCWAV
jgi:hypothetical protein